MTFALFCAAAESFWKMTANGELEAFLDAWPRQDVVIREGFLSFVAGMRGALQLHHLLSEGLLDEADPTEQQTALSVLALDPFMDLSRTRRAALLPLYRAKIPEAELRKAVKLP